MEAISIKIHSRLHDCQTEILHRFLLYCVYPGNVCHIFSFMYVLPESVNHFSHFDSVNPFPDLLVQAGNVLAMFYS